MNQDTNLTPNNESKKNSNWIFFSVIALLLAACIFLLVSRNKQAAENQDLTTQLDSTSQSRDAVRSEYNDALLRLDNLTSQNTALNNEIADKNGEIEKLKKEISSILSNSKATKADLAKAQSLIAQLKEKTKNYEERIAELESENKDLKDVNATLKTEKDATVDENIKLKKLGAVLHISNIRLEAIDLRKNNTKESETSKARKADFIRIKFDIDENRITESGNKDIYIRIIGADGNLLSNAAYGSGISTLSDGSSLHYTLQKQVYIEKEKSTKDVSIDWNQDSSFKKGTYQIEVYSEGYKVGEGSVTLK